MSLESEILKEIKPPKELCEFIAASAEKLKGITEGYLRDRGIEAEVRFVGSVAKNTFLTDLDIDMFVLFPKTVPEEQMESITIQAGKDLIGGRLAYAEHPYTSGKFNGIDVDMVPCYAISSAEKLLTAVDRTPFHANYIITHTDPELCDQIRLTKRFMKGIGTYGAEPDVRGFSGYLCEILTLHFGGFRQTLEAATRWKEGTTITIEQTGPKMKSALVVYDPVDSKRNVASAVHVDTLSRFVLAAREYLKSPDRRFFFPEPIEPMDRESIAKALEDRQTRLVSVIMDKPDLIDESIQAQMWRTRYAIVKKLEKYGFDPLNANHGYTGGRIGIVVEISTPKLSKVFKHEGPPVWVERSEDFVAKWKENAHGDPFIEDGRWVVISERKIVRPEDMLAKELKTAGIGKDLAESSYEILDNDSTVDRIDRLMLTELLFPKQRWE